MHPQVKKYISAHACTGTKRASLWGLEQKNMCTCIHRYRARFIVGTAAELQKKEGGGEAWLLRLRHKSYEEALEALTSLPGEALCVA